MEVRSQLSLGLRASDLSAVARAIEFDRDRVELWLWDLNVDILKIATVKVDLINVEVLQLLKNDRHDDVLRLVRAGLGEGNAETWGGGGRGGGCGQHGPSISKKLHTYLYVSIQFF